MPDRPVLGSWRIPGPIGLDHSSETASDFLAGGMAGAGTISQRRSPPASGQVVALGTKPTEDGQVNTYDVSEYAIFWVPESSTPALFREAPPVRQKRERQKRQGTYKVVFVNGQEGNPSKHMMQACAVAAVSGGPVQGIYNAPKGSVVSDTLKSVWLKMTSATLMNVESAVAGLFSGKTAAEQRIRNHLLRRDCPASAALFDLLLQKDYADARLVGHSQGNLVICNAINAMIASRGDDSVRKMRVIAVASPTFFWEKKEIVTFFNMRNDAVGWLSGDLPNVPASVMGWSAATSDDSQMVTGYNKNYRNVLTHSFYLYLAVLWEKLRPLFP
jgi:hypothetical protein